LERALSESLVTSSPSKRYLPELGRSRHPIMCIRVLLPAPEGPTIEINSPSSTKKEMPFKTGVVTLPEV